MKRFLCLGYYDPAAFDKLTERERDELVAKCRPHDEELKNSGRLRSVASLEHRTATTLRPGRSGPVLIDGPFAEAKEVIGSFFIIEATDLEDAIRIASLHPAARVGLELGFGIEIRPIEFYREE